MPTLADLQAQHTLVNDKYAKLFAASKAIAHKLAAEQEARSKLRKALHVVIGPLAPGTLVMTHRGTRFYEILRTGLAHERFYSGVVIYQTNGERKRAAGVGHSLDSLVECGSVLPVPPTHAVYLKWRKRKMRDALEGKV